MCAVTPLCNMLFVHCGFVHPLPSEPCAGAVLLSHPDSAECASDSRGLHPSASTHALCIFCIGTTDWRGEERGREFSWWEGRREKRRGEKRERRDESGTRREEREREQQAEDARPPSERTGTLMILTVVTDRNVEMMFQSLMMDSSFSMSSYAVLVLVS